MSVEGWERRLSSLSFTADCFKSLKQCHDDKNVCRFKATDYSSCKNFE